MAAQFYLCLCAAGKEVSWCRCAQVAGEMRVGCVWACARLCGLYVCVWVCVRSWGREHAGESRATTENPPACQPCCVQRLALDAFQHVRSHREQAQGAACALAWGASTGRCMRTGTGSKHRALHAHCNSCGARCERSKEGGMAKAQGGQRGRGAQGQQKHACLQPNLHELQSTSSWLPFHLAWLASLARVTGTGMDTGTHRHWHAQARAMARAKALAQARTGTCKGMHQHLCRQSLALAQAGRQGQGHRHGHGRKHALARDWACCSWHACGTLLASTAGTRVLPGHWASCGAAAHAQ